MQRIFSVKEKRDVAAVFSLCRCFLETILLFPTLRATFRRHICPRSSQPWLRGFAGRSFPKRPARRRGTCGSLIEDQTLRSFFFELGRVRGAAIGTVGAPNNLR